MGPSRLRDGDGVKEILYKQQEWETGLLNTQRNSGNIPKFSWAKDSPAHLGWL